MVDTFTNGSQHLMHAWKRLRSELSSDLSDRDHLSMVTDFWSHSPISSRTLGWNDPASWPDAWSLMHLADFDESSVALSMFYTLSLSNDQRWNDGRLSLILIKDLVREIQRLVLMVDQKWILNLEYNTILDACAPMPGFTVQQRYSYDGKIHSSLKGRRMKPKQVMDL